MSHPMLKRRTITGLLEMVCAALLWVAISGCGENRPKPVNTPGPVVPAGAVAPVPSAEDKTPAKPAPPPKQSPRHLASPAPRMGRLRQNPDRLPGKSYLRGPNQIRHQMGNLSFLRESRTCSKPSISGGTKTISCPLSPRTSTVPCFVSHPPVLKPDSQLL